jgi:hypothetical protein
VYDFQFYKGVPQLLQPRDFSTSLRRKLFLQLQRQLMRLNTEEVS